LLVGNNNRGLLAQALEIGIQSLGLATCQEGERDPPSWQANYCLKFIGGPLTRFPFRSTVTSTRSAIVTNGMP
jgi:hypothetical protein